MNIIPVVYTNDTHVLNMGISPLTPHIENALWGILDTLPKQSLTHYSKRFCVAITLVVYMDMFFDDGNPVFPIRQVEKTASRPSGLLFAMEYDEFVDRFYGIGIDGQTALFEGARIAHPELIAELERKYEFLEKRNPPE